MTRLLLGRLLTPIGLLLMSLLASPTASAQAPATVVRIAQLRTKPAQLAAYTAALKEEIETSVCVEPGVLSLSAVAAKDDPAHLTIFEVYASPQAYLAHLQTPHFKKYKSLTQDMVASLELAETVPVVLGVKGK